MPSLSQRLILAMTAVALVSAGGVVLALGPVEAHLEPLVAQARLRELDEAADALTRDLDGARRLVRLVTRGPDVRGALALHDTRGTVETFRALLDTHPELLQARLVSTAGVGPEVVRVQRDMPGGPVRVLRGPELQAKGHRDYVRRAMALPDGEVFISAIEPNREHGVQETPVRLVLRAATPVRAGGLVRGVVVLNYDLTPRLARVAELADGLEVYLLDAEDRFLMHPAPRRLYTRAADEFAWIRGAVDGDAGSLTTLVAPDGASVMVASRRVQPGGGPPARLVMVGPAPHVAAIDQARGLMWRAGLAAAGLAAGLAFFLGRRVSRPLRALAASAATFPHGTEPLPVDAVGEIGALARALEGARTELRAREAALDKERRRFRRLFELVPTPVLLIDDQGRIRLANERAVALFGYPADALDGMAVGALVPAAQRAPHAQLVAAYYRAPEARLMGEGRDLRCVRADGLEVPVEIGLAPLETDEGLRVLVSIVDLTDRQRREEELRRSNADLEQFAYIASHDLQEPLRNVGNFAELLAERYEGQLDDRADRYIGFVIDGVHRMKRLVSDLLAYSRVGARSAQKREVPLGQVVDAALASVATQLREGHATVTREPDLPTVHVDPGQLEQVFVNLITNALKFCGADPARIEIAATQVAGAWQITVRDHGIGMEMRYAEAVFEMFRRLHGPADYPGSGVGLAIVRRVVEHHGGRAWITSTPGDGTTVTFTLPDE